VAVIVVAPMTASALTTDAHSYATVTVTFNADGGVPTPASMSGAIGTTIIVPGAPTPWSGLSAGESERFKITQLKFLQRRAAR